jgi:release factor glutamine methyltransferase
MTVEAFLRDGTQKLVQAGIETARLDVLVLLDDCSGTNRAQLLAHPEFELTDRQVQLLDAQLARRAEHEPLAYIRGKSEFYGREFIVSPAVLVPRPESEAMIELLKDLVKRNASDSAVQELPGSDRPENGLHLDLPLNDSGVYGAQKAVPFDKVVKSDTVIGQKSLTSKVISNLIIGDVGTGSGALGITAALEVPGCQLELLEIDQAALQVAEQNASKYALKLARTRSDLLTDSTLPHDILLCNLPYVPDDFVINQAAMAEPKLALFAGIDGLDLFRRLFDQIQARKAKPWLILTESLPTQHGTLAQLAATAGYTQTAENDFIQAFKLP